MEDRRDDARHAGILCWTVYLVLAVFVVTEKWGQTTSDTRLDLTEAPGEFLRGTFSLWSPRVSLGELQNQAYGYLFPQGSFFALLECGAGAGLGRGAGLVGAGAGRGLRGPAPGGPRDLAGSVGRRHRRALLRAQPAAHRRARGPQRRDPPRGGAALGAAADRARRQRPDAAAQRGGAVRSGVRVLRRCQRHGDGRAAPPCSWCSWSWASGDPPAALVVRPVVGRADGRGQRLVGVLAAAAGRLQPAVLRLRRGRPDHDGDRRVRVLAAGCEQLGQPGRRQRQPLVAGRVRRLLQLVGGAGVGGAGRPRRGRPAALPRPLPGPAARLRRPRPHLPLHRPRRPARRPAERADPRPARRPARPAAQHCQGRSDPAGGRVPGAGGPGRGLVRTRCAPARAAPGWRGCAGSAPASWWERSRWAWSACRGRCWLRTCGRPAGSEMPGVLDPGRRLPRRARETAGAAWVVPGSGFGIQTWGWTMEEPMQVLADSRG